MHVKYIYMNSYLSVLNLKKITRYINNHLSLLYTEDKVLKLNLLLITSSLNYDKYSSYI